MTIQLKKTYFENKNAPIFFACALWEKMMLLFDEVTLQVILPAIINVAQSSFEKALVSNQNFAHDKMNKWCTCEKFVFKNTSHGVVKSPTL